MTGQLMFAITLWRSKPLFARMNSCCAKNAKNAWYSGCTASASTNPVPAVAMCLKHLIYDISCVCVCVRMNFSAICRLAPCLWDMGISKHKRRNATTRPVHLNSTGLFLQKQGVRRWNEAIFSCSTKASNSFTQNARQNETGRSGKREAKKRLYKLQPLRQQKAIAIWPETRLNMGTVYMKQKGTHVTTIHWGYHFEAPRSSGASSSCLLHAPSCKDKASDNTKG